MLIFSCEEYNQPQLEYPKSVNKALTDENPLNMPQNPLFWV